MQGAIVEQESTATTEVVEQPKVVRAYKGFDENFRCRDFTYEVGKTYTHEGEVSPCNSGFHACTRPSDVWSYYGPCAARFALVELSGTVVEHDDDSKHAASVIRIVEEIPLKSFIKLVIDDVAETAKENRAEGYKATAASSGDSSTAASSGNYSTAASSGNSSKAASSGDYSTAASSGDYSTAASSGDYSTAASSGNYSTAASSGNYSKAEAKGQNTIAMVAGLAGRAKAGPNGCFALCWDDGQRNRIVTGYVGEDEIEADVWYRIDNGKLVKA